MRFENALSLKLKIALVDWNKNTSRDQEFIFYFLRLLKWLA